MYLTSSEIFDIVWDWIKKSPLAKAVPTMYPDHYPKNPTGEFIVMRSKSNVVGDKQVADVNVNIYVPDRTPSIGSVRDQRYPNKNRIAELSRIAYDSLKGYPRNERWFFDVSYESLISEEENILYSFSNIVVKFINY